jgi:hypothetical protein
MGDVVVFKLAMDVERVKPAPNECGLVVTFTGMWHEPPKDYGVETDSAAAEKGLGKRGLSGQLSRFLGLGAR